MLRLVREGEQAPQNEALRVALDRVTRGSPVQETGLPILDEHEAEALYRVLSSRSFTQAQLDSWIGRLLADHPYERIRRGKSPSLWAVVKWVFMGGEKPWKDAPVESATDWVKRTERWIQEQVANVDEPTWLERPLQALNVARHQIGRGTGRSQWAIPVLRWALVQLLMLPQDVDASDINATG